MPQDDKKQKIQALYGLISQLKTPEECQLLFDDLCTKREIEKMAERLHAAKLLLQGYTYSQVMAETDISSATLSRVSQCVQYGQGYSTFLKEE